MEPAPRAFNDRLGGCVCAAYFFCEDLVKCRWLAQSKRLIVWQIPAANVHRSCILKTNAETMLDLGLLSNMFTNVIKPVWKWMISFRFTECFQSGFGGELLTGRGSDCLVQRQIEFSSACRMKQSTVELSARRCSAQLSQGVLHHIKLSWFVHRVQQLLATVELQLAVHLFFFGLSSV